MDAGYWIPQFPYLKDMSIAIHQESNAALAVILIVTALINKSSELQESILQSCALAHQNQHSPNIFLLCSTCQEIHIDVCPTLSCCFTKIRTGTSILAPVDATNPAREMWTINSSPRQYVNHYY